MQSIDTLIHARWVIPVDTHNRILDNCALAIHEGQILDILPSQEALKKYSGRSTFQLDRHALIPGLINAHGHTPMTLFRGLADDLPLMDWLNKHIWPAEMKWVSDAFVRDGSRLAMAEMIKSGTTTFTDMYFFPEATAHAALEAHMRAVIGLIMVDFPSPYAQSADEYFNKGLKLHDDLRSSALVTTAFAPHAPYTVSDAPLAKVRTFSDELDVPVTIHVHETAHEVDAALQGSGRRPLARLMELDLLNPRLVAVHMTQLLDAEIQTLADQGVHVVHCPESNLKLASGFCPVEKLLAAGVNVALGTDGAASNNDLDMFGEMRTAALLAKGVSASATAVPAQTALRMATINGARALGLDEVTGSLEIGKAADIVAVDMSSLNSQPVYDPVSQIVYTCDRNQVTHVWVAGKPVLENRKLTTLDEERLMANAQTWRDKIAFSDQHPDAQESR